MNVAWFSCGVASAVACHLSDSFELFYIGIKSAHPDNDRFIADFERVAGRKVNYIASKKYIDQFDVIEKRRFINGPAGALCTRELKMEVRWALEETHDCKTQVFGFTIEEKDRAKKFRLNYPEIKCVFPLIDKGLTKRDCKDYVTRRLGIKLPRMYALGYKNNNCIGCVKGGRGYWQKIRVDFPAYFKRMAELERSVGRSCINGIFLDELPPEKPQLFVSVPECSSFCSID